jgi:formate hydrogenlyase subunit 6/NADH:ubiquinone oxidoreductase subunit I
MFKHTISELKEALICLQAGQVTFRYPYQPRQPEATFRGLPALDAQRCIGCGACANACPPRLISLVDEGECRRLHFELARCTYCASCRDACPRQALTLTLAFETATTSTEDLVIDFALPLAHCRLCGEPLGTQRAFEDVRQTLQEAGALTEEGLAFLELCTNCKRWEGWRAQAFLVELEVAA